MTSFIDVVPLKRLPRGVRQRYTYRFEGQLSPSVGAFVEIPFRGQQLLGVVVATHDEGDPQKTKLALPSSLGFTYSQHILFNQLVERYGAPESLAALTIVPRLSPSFKSDAHVSPAAASIDNRKAESALATALAKETTTIVSGNVFSPAHDAVRARLRQVLQAQAQALCLLPDKVSLLHAASVLADLEPVILSADVSAKKWNHLYGRLLSGEPLLVLGTRSAVFAPFQNLQHIFLFDGFDDGHRSWDQEPTYDARVLAQHLSEQLSVPFTIGSVAPPVFSTTAIQLVRLPNRFPPMQVIKWERRSADQTIQQLLDQASTKRVLLYVNRRGGGLFACADCHAVLSCPTCKRPVPAPVRGLPSQCPHCTTAASEFRCPDCQAVTFRRFGGGTDLLEQELQEKSRGRATVVRLDAEFFSRKKAAEELPEISRKPGIFIASSAILSRLWLIEDFDHIVADRPEYELSAPSWRANEDCLAALVTLRAHAKQSFLLLSATPQHPLFQLASKLDLRTFLREESEFRRRHGYPPFSELVRLSRRGQEGQDSATLVAALRAAGVEIVQADKLHITARTRQVASVWPLLEQGWRVDINPTNM